MNLFTKLFQLLPVGSWAVCDIPLTYWLLIYRDCWDDIFISVANNFRFPYDKYLQWKLSIQSSID